MSWKAMASYILKRILSLIPTFFGATFLAFLIICFIAILGRCFLVL